jgi:hypothetical protein
MSDANSIVREKVAFDGERSGYRFVATYLSEPKGEALIEISKDGALVKSFLWPAYKVWNIAAHADDIADSLGKGDEQGFYVAGEVGFGVNVYQSEK